MDLLDIMANGEDADLKALSKLEDILVLYESEDEAVQEEALARAISFCGTHWRSYRAGIERLAERLEGRAGDPMVALALREEAEDPGSIIRAVRARRAEMEAGGAERAALAAKYGSVEAAAAPGPLERLFIQAARHLAPEDCRDDPRAPLAGWSLPWHPIPEALRTIISRGLPATIPEARAETLAWEMRLGEYQILAGGGRATLPTACAARLNLVQELWARDLPAASPADLEVRLEYWVERGSGDGAGYAAILDDVRRLGRSGWAARPEGGTGDRARALKAEHPDWSLARIGAELGISRQAVHKHLKARPSEG